MIKRIEWIDIAKGIGIIFVMIGHCVYFGGGIHNFIFSWHMPMFFILSGFVFVIEDKKKDSKKKIENTFVAICIIFMYWFMYNFNYSCLEK